MTISYPITLPSSPAPARVMLTARNVVGFSQSPFTGQQQVHRHDGAFWMLEFALPAMEREQADIWLAALISLRGRYGTFYMGDPSAATPRGVATGTPVVDGAGQTGDTIDLRGFTISTTGILLAGDYLQIGSQLHRNLTDADSDGSGNVTLDVWPPVRTAPSDGDSVTLTNTVGKFRLSGNDSAWSIDPGIIYQGITISAMEAL